MSGASASTYGKAVPKVSHPCVRGHVDNAGSVLQMMHKMQPVVAGNVIMSRSSATCSGHYRINPRGETYSVTRVSVTLAVKHPIDFEIAAGGAAQ